MNSVESKPREFYRYSHGRFQILPKPISLVATLEIVCGHDANLGAGRVGLMMTVKKSTTGLTTIMTTISGSTVQADKAGGVLDDAMVGKKLTMSQVGRLQPRRRPCCENGKVVTKGNTSNESTMNNGYNSVGREIK